MTRLAILADDLTGAADAGGAFASAGLRTTLALAGTPAIDPDILVRSTESRGMEPAAAAEANHQAALRLHPSPALPPIPVYKKIDSMLRGHPCEELRAVMAGLGEHRALVAPALPAHGRTTVGARQLIDGSPVVGRSPGRGDDRADLLQLFRCRGDLPVRSLDLATVRRGVDAVAGVLDALDSGILIADAETGDDLATIARATIASEIQVIAGSAGLARQLAIVLTVPTPPAVPPARPAGPVLIVAASRHPATAAQVEALRGAGVPVVRPTQAILDGAATSIGSVVDELERHLAAHPAVALTTAGLAPGTKGAAFVVTVLGAVVAMLADRCPLSGLAVTGGDVAAGVLAALDATELELRGELAPAIPWGTLRSRLSPDLPVVTKAGSFGAPDTLLRAVSLLAR